ncbi:DUF3592 domain-containing protein [Streptomyces sp. NBC_00467]|uniref:DUF3592 domain-containing protein n=1 Tax=Streptomyces sp. NBC_00467 TaxID=2975752 RepID=UPI002E1794EB
MVIPLIPLTIGAAFLSFGVYGLRRARVLHSAGVTVEGRIARHHVRQNDEGVTFYHPVAAWTTRDGARASTRPGSHAVRSGTGTVSA